MRCRMSQHGDPVSISKTNYYAAAAAAAAAVILLLHLFRSGGAQKSLKGKVTNK